MQILGFVAQDQAVQRGRALAVNGMLGALVRARLRCTLAQLGFLDFNVLCDLLTSP